MTAAILVAKERQLDWLLEEAFGTARRAAVPVRSHWLAAALVVLAIGAAFGVAWLRSDGADVPPAQEPVDDVQWFEAHGFGSLGTVPDDVVNLRCFDFDDDALRELPRFTKLQRLDLGGMDVNDKGYSVSLPITDAGVAHLGKLKNLRWLSLASCHAMKGTSLHVLENVPLLEHLDLTYSGVESPAVERLALLGSLRELVLSHCMNFHGRSLAAVAKSPGLRRLELRACTTLSAADALHLAKITTLRHLDLRDCQGRFRGQRSSGLSHGGKDKDVNEEPPTEDGRGITDEVVAALSALPLETLLLGGSESLTDAVGDSLARMTTLRSLDLSNLPGTSGALLAKVPSALEHFWLDDNRQLAPEELRRLPPLRSLRTLGISGLQIDGVTLQQLLDAKSLRKLSLGGPPARGKGARPPDLGPPPPNCATLVAAQHDLESLDLRDAPFVDRAFLATIASLPRLRELDLTGPLTNPLPDRSTAIRGLAANRSLRSLTLMWNRIDAATLAELREVPLRELDLYGTGLKNDAVRSVAAAWPGCIVKMPGGQRYVVPVTR